MQLNIKKGKVELKCPTALLFAFLCTNTLVNGQTNFHQENCKTGISISEFDTFPLVYQEEYDITTFDSITESKIRSLSENLFKEIRIEKCFGLGINVELVADSSNSITAFSTSLVTDKRYQDGTIIIGENYLSTLPDILHDYLLYHHVAHIFEIKSKSSFSDWESELFADFVAGFVIGYYKKRQETSMLYFQSKNESDTYLNESNIKYQSQRNAVFDLGDYQLESSKHRGFKEEKFFSFFHGFKYSQAKYSELQDIFYSDLTHKEKKRAYKECSDEYLISFSVNEIDKSSSFDIKPNLVGILKFYQEMCHIASLGNYPKRFHSLFNPKE